MEKKKGWRWFDGVYHKRGLVMLVEDIHQGLDKINFGWSQSDNHAIEIGLTIAREATVELEALDNDLKRRLRHLGKIMGSSIDNVEEHDDDDVEEDEKEYECPYGIEPQQCERNLDGRPIMSGTNSVPMDCLACVYINYARR